MWTAAANCLEVEERSMTVDTTPLPNHRLGVPGLVNLEVPDLLTDMWRDTVRRALTRANEIAEQRQVARDQRKFEYQHFYSAWVGLAFRFRDCAIYDRTFTASFERSHGDANEETLYEEDAALFGFFVKGLSALDCFTYGLYALGALIRTPTTVPSVRPITAFPLLVPVAGKLQSITFERTQQTFAGEFAGQPITNHLTRLWADPDYKNWKYIRNVLAHRAASAGRSLDYSRSLGAQTMTPLSVTQWGGDIPLSVETTSSRYIWLRETVNAGLQAAAAFAAAELPYQEDELPQPLL